MAQLASIADKLCSLYELGARIRIDPLVGNSDDLYRRSLYIPQQPQEQAKNDRRRNFDLAAAAFLQILQFYKWHRIRYIDDPPPAHRNKYNALGRSHRHILLFISGIRISGGRILQTDRLRTQPPGLCTVHFIFSANSFGSYQHKAKDLLPQIKSLKTFDADKATQGLKLLLWGLFLKVVLADRLGLYVDSIYDNYTYQTGFSLFVASLCYSLQIYGDFAGYSLMAIGVAKVLGFDLINNFNRPYFATSITDFWHRWHISLSIWLRDYVYIPLGGSRCSKLRTYWNIFATFLVSGIWHGANWTFIIWGIIHGVAQIAEKALRLQKYEGGGNRRLRIIITFLIVNFAWIFFRMPSITDACKVIGKIFTDFGTTLFLSNNSNMIYMLVAVCILFFKDMRDEFFPRRFLFFENRNIAIRWSSYLFLMFLILLTGVLDSGQFIYVNF